MFSGGSPWFDAVIQAIWFMPLFIVYLVGIFFALARWQRHPRASMVALSGFLVLIVGRIVMAAEQILAFGAFTPSNAYYFNALGGVNTLIHVSGMSLLVTAIFVGRRDESQPRYREPLPELPDDRPPEGRPVAQPESGIRERRM
jgi:hypothetical protein